MAFQCPDEPAKSGHEQETEKRERGEEANDVRRWS